MLREFYIAIPRQASGDELADCLGRSAVAVRARAKVLRQGRDETRHDRDKRANARSIPAAHQRGQRWSKQDTDLLRASMDVSPVKLAAVLNRTVAAVTVRRSRILTGEV